MSEPEISKRRLQAFKRFLERLPHGKDVDLFILKAHLLIEEQINALIRERLESPDTLLAEERFESIYRIRLAQSFFERDHAPWLWHAVVQLNKLRNRVAHSIDPKGRENIMLDVVQSVPMTAGKDTRPLQDRFEFTIWYLFEAISSLVEPSKGKVLELVPPSEE
jgi:hypothetical protein